MVERVHIHKIKDFLQAKLSRGIIIFASIRRFQKISIPIPRMAFRISEEEGGSRSWNSECMGGIFTNGNSQIEFLE